MADPGSDGDLLARLASHRAIGKVPREELEWLVAHGTIEQYVPGDMIARKGQPVEALYIILKGHVAHFTDQGGSMRKAVDWHDGDATGMLPYSRLVNAPGNTVILEPTEILRVAREHLPALPVDCPQVTAELVHVMVDRARAFKASDLQVEKMASLGKLAAGLAHELNNPASAAARSAQLISEALAESEEASREFGAANLDDRAQAVVERVRWTCSGGPTTGVFSPLERADREEALTDTTWTMHSLLRWARPTSPSHCSTSWRQRSMGASFARRFAGWRPGAPCGRWRRMSSGRPHGSTSW
jgi:signal transduction histidine kinase